VVSAFFQLDIGVEKSLNVMTRQLCEELKKPNIPYVGILQNFVDFQENGDDWFSNVFGKWVGGLLFSPRFSLHALLKIWCSICQHETPRNGLLAFLLTITVEGILNCLFVITILIILRCLYLEAISAQGRGVTSFQVFLESLVFEVETMEEARFIIWLNFYLENCSEEFLVGFLGNIRWKSISYLDDLLSESLEQSLLPPNA